MADEQELPVEQLVERLPSGKPKKGGRAEAFQPHVLAHIYTRFKQLRTQGEYVMNACQTIADELSHTGLSVSAARVWFAVDRMRPTDKLASVYLKSKAYRLAQRIVKTASAAEAIDLLSRPSMGVIAPRAKESGEGGGGFFLSVQMESCGAVKIGATNDRAAVQGALPAKTPDDVDIFEGEVVTYASEDPESGYPAPSGQLSDEARRLQLLENARKRLQAAREGRGRQPESGPRLGGQGGEEIQGL